MLLHDVIIIILILISPRSCYITFSHPQSGPRNNNIYHEILNIILEIMLRYYIINRSTKKNQ